LKTASAPLAAEMWPSSKCSWVVAASPAAVVVKAVAAVAQEWTVELTA